MTHGPPLGVLDLTSGGEQVGCQNLLRAARRCKPRLHCFGHIHEGWGAQLVQWKEGDELDVEDEAQIAKVTEVAVDAKRMETERAAHIGLDVTTRGEIEFGTETLMVNASIMTVTYKPWNAPWVVDLHLERAVSI